MSSLQCLKRVHLEVHHPELAEWPVSAQAAFDIGHRVGELALQVLGGDRGVMVDYEGGDFANALARTEVLMAEANPVPIYEATLQHEGVLVREDVLLSTGDGSWRVIEVKAATSLKDIHLQDCAIQAWVHQGAGHPLASISLAHVDNQWVCPGGDDYRGLFTEQDLTGEVRALEPLVPEWVARARAAVDGPMPEVPVGPQCTQPYGCPFMRHCWPSESDYPVQGLGGAKKKLGEWIARGWRDVRDVPPSEITGDVQSRIRRVTAAGAPELLEGARRFVDELAYPRFYLDFETAGPAIPIWPGTRPYQGLPFQWSCHVERAPGAIEHFEFLDLSGEPPMRSLAEQLIRDLETSGPVLMYTSFERGVIRTLAELFPDLAGPLRAIIERLVDLHPVVKQNYYHPSMLGSWSIKAVLPTIEPDLDYAGLEGIKEGMGASEAYLEAIAPGVNPARKAQIERELLTYCRRDTEAMVRLVQFLGGDAAG